MTLKAAPVPALDSWTAKQRLKTSSLEQRATPLVMTRPLPAQLLPPAPPQQPRFASASWGRWVQCQGMAGTLHSAMQM